NGRVGKAERGEFLAARFSAGRVVVVASASGKHGERRETGNEPDAAMPKQVHECLLVCWIESGSGATRGILASLAIVASEIRRRTSRSFSQQGSYPAFDEAGLSDRVNCSARRNRNARAAMLRTSAPACTGRSCLPRNGTRGSRSPGRP